MRPTRGAKSARENGGGGGGDDASREQPARANGMLLWDAYAGRQNVFIKYFKLTDVYFVRNTRARVCGRGRHAVSAGVSRRVSKFDRFPAAYYYYYFSSFSTYTCRV